MSWPARIAFWIAIGLSCLCLALTVFIGAIAHRIFFKEGFAFAGRGPLEIAAALAFALQPVIVLYLIVRAVRLRRIGGSLQIIARSLYPLFTIVLLPLVIETTRYLDTRFEARRAMRWRASGITYNCRTFVRHPDGKPRTKLPTILLLTKYRHPGKPDSWIVIWPKELPIKTESFDIPMGGSIGGSQGIKWREPDGRHMVAVLSFSDLVAELGPLGLWGEMVEGDSAAGLLRPHATPSTGFGCDASRDDI